MKKGPLTACGVLLLVLASLGWAHAPLAHAQAVPVVHAVLLYSDSCGAPCEPLFTTVLPTLVSRYGPQLELMLLDVDLEANQSVVRLLRKKLAVPETTGYPLLIVDQTVLPGLQEIDRQAETEIMRMIASSGKTQSPLIQITNDYESELESARHENQTLTNELQTLTQTNQELNQEQEDLLKSRNLLLVSAAVLAGASLTLLVLVLINVQRRREQPKGSWPADTGPLTVSSHVQTTRAQEASLIRTLIGQGSPSIDFMAEMMRIQHEYARKGKVPEDAVYLARDFLGMAEHNLGLCPVERYGSQVPFDPARHRAYEHYDPGELVRVVRPGWERDGRILKYAIVKG